MKATILITGGTGFLGSHLICALLKQDHEIILLKRPFSNIQRIAQLLPYVKIYDADLQKIDKIFFENNINIVIHTACCYGRRNESLSSILAANTSYGIKILECAMCHKVEVFINTDTIFDKYFSPYTLSKRQFVEWLNFFSNDIKVINMKLEHMYGPNDDNKKFVTWLLQQFKENVREIKLTSGIQKRDFIYISDVVSAYLTVINHYFELNHFNEFEVGTGNSMPVRDFVEEMEKQYKERYPECESVLNFGAMPYRKNENMNVAVNISMLKKINWIPEMDYTAGIKKLLDAET
jgi:nucleoside-diphosphate-sugar epimerase